MFYFIMTHQCPTTLLDTDYTAVETVLDVIIAVLVIVAVVMLLAVEVTFLTIYAPVLITLPENSPALERALLLK